MAAFKCKMCGGDLEITEGVSVAECEYCGTRQTVPQADNEKKMTLFGRANRLRLANEFDKAAGIYESIVAEFPEEAEAYWGLVLCKYGIEYVDDPATGKKIPTCHRSSFESIMDDQNFEQAQENADPMARRIYRDEAKTIEDIRKKIIEISGKEDPYDIFICYKETAEDGGRTIDSVLAQDIYTELTEKGYRVFFSRISLEDKLGVEYEPYIFAALHSAKVMLAVGTDFEHYNAVWVKNEWSRFLQMIASGEKKVLIPCFKGLDAYDMPKEFAHLQAQDMGKVGAMQDLIRGIDKIFGKNLSGSVSSKQTVIVQQQGGTPSIDSLLKRGFMYLEDSDWKNGKQYFQKVLDIEPENAQGYLGLTMAQYEISTKEVFAAAYIQEKVPDDDRNFARVKQFSDAELLAWINELEEKKKQNEEDRQRQIAVSKENSAKRKQLAAASQLIAARNSQTVCLKVDGTVMAMGNNEYGQCNVKDWSNVVAVAASGCHTVGLKSDGTVIAAGYNGYNRCSVGNWSDIVAVATGDSHTVGLKSNGTVVAVGNNKHGACGVKEWCHIVAIACTGLSTIGLKSDGTLISAGDEENWNINAWRDIVAIACGVGHVVGLKSDGTVVTTESFEDKQYGTEEWTDIVAVAAGDRYTFGLKKDGTVVVAGQNETDQWGMDSWCDIVAVTGGNHHIVGVKADGFMVAVGNNEYGQCDIQGQKLFNNVETIKQEGNGARHLAALAEKRKQCALAAGLLAHSDTNMIGLALDGAVAAIGDNRASQCNVEKWHDITAVSCGAFYCVGLKSDRTVTAVGFNEYGQCNTSNWQDIIAVACGPGHTIGLKADGTVVATGYNEYGQCNVSEMRDIVAVACGVSHTVGLKSDGTVVAVGNNEYNQCEVENWSDIVAVAGGGAHTVGLKSDGTVVAAGKDQYTRHHGNVDEWRDIVEIACGRHFTIGLKLNGTVVTAGDNKYGQCNVKNWHDTVAIAGSEFYTFGLRSDGTIEVTGQKPNEPFYDPYPLCQVRIFSSIDTLEQERETIKARRGVLLTKRQQSAAASKFIVGRDFRFVMMKLDGTVEAADKNRHNEYGQCDVSSWRNIVAVDCNMHHTVGLKSNGTVIATGKNKDGQCNVSDWRDIVSVACGFSFTVGVKSDGTVVLSGKDESSSFVQRWRDIVMVACNTTDVYGLKSDGTVVTTQSSWSETSKAVKKWQNIVALACCPTHIVGLRANGTVVASGSKNSYGELNVNNWEDVVSIAVGQFRTVGVKSDGTVVATGINNCSQCDVSGLRNIVAVACVDDCTVGLQSDGTIVTTKSDCPDLICGKKWRLFNSIDTLEQEWRDAKVAEHQRQKNELNQERETLKAKLASLNGPFSSMRRKQIEKRLAEIEQELKSR